MLASDSENSWNSLTPSFPSAKKGHHHARELGSTATLIIWVKMFILNAFTATLRGKYIILKV